MFISWRTAAHDSHLRGVPANRPAAPAGLLRNTFITAIRQDARWALRWGEGRTKSTGWKRKRTDYNTIQQRSVSKQQEEKNATQHRIITLLKKESRANKWNGIFLFSYSGTLGGWVLL